MRTLKYSLTSDDYVAFNEYVATSMPPYADQARRARVVGATMVPLVVGIALWVLERNLLASVIGAAVASVILWFTWPGFHRWSVASRLKRLASSGELGRTGATTLAWDEERVTEAARASRAEIGWERLERVAETPKHLFLFVGAQEALIVPKRAGEDTAELAGYARARLDGGSAG